MLPENRLIIAIVIGAIAGLLCGWWFGEAMVSIAWVGQLFLDLLKMMIVPLIAAAIISGITSLGDIRQLKKVGLTTLLYYALTTSCAVLVGLIVVNVIQPGAGIAEFNEPLPSSIAEKQGTGISDIVQSLVSPNIVAAAANTQLLPLIVFCILFAAALTTIGEKKQPVIRFFEGLNEVMMRLIIWIMYFAPIGIFALIAGQFGQAASSATFQSQLLAVGSYCLTVILGLAVHFVILLMILLVFTRYGRSYLVSLLRALVTAFGSASSSATLPLTMDCVIKAGVDKRSAKFVLPIGSTVNMDGTALYEAVAAMFIAQAYNIDLSITQQAIIFITATLAAIGAAGIPQAGLVTLLIVLNAVNLPIEGIGLILAVDWLLDRFRTTVNVWGDSIGAAVVEKYLPESKEPLANNHADK